MMNPSRPKARQEVWSSWMRVDIFNPTASTTALLDQAPTNGGNENVTISSFKLRCAIVNGRPVSLVGGTAAIYSTLLKHPSSTLTELSLLFMALLALQYALQPRLSKRYISPKTNKQAVALVEEIVKTGMAALIFASKPQHVVRQSFRDWSLTSSLTVAGLPAMLYALQGVLQYVSHQHLDPVTFNGLTQTKTLSAAFCCWIILGKPQSLLQIIALTILFGSALVFQGHFRFKGNNITATATTIASVETSSSRTRLTDDWIWRGVVPCLGAAFVSGLAGALSQKGLQLTGISGRDPFLYTMEVSFYSAVTLLISMAQSSTNIQMELAKQRTQWTCKTLIPIIIKAAGGVITALVHKYAGSVAKGFALMFGLVLSGTIQMFLAEESLRPHQVVGTLMIMLATWMHFTHPPV